MNNLRSNSIIQEKSTLKNRVSHDDHVAMSHFRYVMSDQSLSLTRVKSFHYDNPANKYNRGYFKGPSKHWKV